MEEKIIVNGKYTARKLITISVVILTLLITFAFLYFVPFKAGVSSYNQHIVDQNHYYECYNLKGRELYDDFSSGSDLNKIDGVSAYFCEYTQFDSAFSCGLSNTIYNWQNESIAIITSALLIIVITVALYIRSTKCKFSITETAIHGKKGLKKFNIEFSNIIQLSKIKKGIFIKTEKEKLKLSPFKNHDEAYNFIKQYVPENPISQPVPANNNYDWWFVFVFPLLSGILGFTTANAEFFGKILRALLYIVLGTILTFIIYFFITVISELFFKKEKIKNIFSCALCIVACLLMIEYIVSQGYVEYTPPVKHTNNKNHIGNGWDKYDYDNDGGINQGEWEDAIGDALDKYGY